MTSRSERRAEERARAKAARKEARALAQLDAGREVIFEGGWPSWSPFVLLHGPGSPFCEMVGGDFAYANSRYQVVVKFERSWDGWPPLMHLSIKTHDKRCVHDWRDMQRIKNELAGTEAEGVELYPAESRLMDEANQFHIYCTHPLVKMPFGQKERTHITPEEHEVGYAGKDPSERPVQRPFEDHHGADGCSPEGIVPWPLWALRHLKQLGFPVEV